MSGAEVTFELIGVAGLVLAVQIVIQVPVPTIFKSLSYPYSFYLDSVVNGFLCTKLVKNAIPSKLSDLEFLTKPVKT